MGVITNRYLDDITWEDAKMHDLVLSDNQVHVWRISISQHIKLLSHFETLLSPDEIRRAGKYKQQKDTHRFIVSRAAQRIILGCYINMSPAQLQFVLGDNKKPYLLNQKGKVLHYNLSHAADWIMLAVAVLPVGSDVEFIDKLFPFTDIIEDNFSKAEADYIGTSHERFFAIWTRKEAILKATGQGLGDHLKVTPALDGAHSLSPILTGANKDWQLNSFHIDKDYAGTVVVENTGQGIEFYNASL